MNEVIEMTREGLLALAADLGNPGGQLDDVDDDLLMATIRNRLQLVCDVATIEKALMRELPTEWRAALVTRRIDLENAKRAVADAMAGRPPRTGGLTVAIPDGMGISHFVAGDGRTVVARIENGRVVLDLFRSEYMALISGPNGQAWQACNEAVTAQLANLPPMRQ
jgi:hypothetical protein